MANLNHRIIGHLLARFNSFDLPRDAFQELIRTVHSGKPCRYEVVGILVHKFLVVLDLFIDSGTHTDGYMTYRGKRKFNQRMMLVDACQNQVDDLVYYLFPAIKVALIPRSIIRASRVLIGAKSVFRSYYNAAKVTSAVLGHFNNDIESRESICRRFQVTRHDANGKMNAARVSGSGDLRLTEAAIGYTFHDVTLLEDAMSRLENWESLQRLSCQRLEYLGDALIDIYVIEHWLSALPDCNGSQLRQLHQSSSNRKVLSAASANLCLESHIHCGNPLLASQVTQMVEDLVIAKWEDRIFGAKVPYWRRILISDKVLCDVFESMIGAVFVDSGFDMDITRKVFDRTLRPILVEYLTPQSH
ncbi:Dicer-like protein 1 [Mortierella sp. AD094]|nr:Dicer-like protein 1 [Mortierella sp. AD094]